MSDSSTVQSPAPLAAESSPKPEAAKPEASAAAVPSQDPGIPMAPPVGDDPQRKRRRRRRRGGKRPEGAAGTPRGVDAASSPSEQDSDLPVPPTSSGQADRDDDARVPAALKPAVPADAQQPASGQAQPSRPGRDRDRDRRRRRDDFGSEFDGRTPDSPGVRESSDTERPSAAENKEDGSAADIDPSRLDSDGLKILNRLHRFEHQGYFVGGCVRDLLLDRAPKDFDIATSAHPGEVRSLFRNCRLIGRRFRLAHVFFRGGKIIEVATFRAPAEANPTEAEDGEDLPEDLLITRDNVFGTAEQDARRRDFTVNGLFYDIRQGRVIDHVRGLPDLYSRTIRTIGDPEVRMREDPVRILRAVRFAARLDFEIDSATYAAMEGAVEELPRCAPARLLEEILRLLRSGYSRRTFELLYALGAMRVLLPPVADHLDRATPEIASAFWARLGALDARIRQGTVDDSIIIAVMLHPLARAMPEPDGGEEVALGEAVDTLLDQMVQTARLPRRLGDRARLLLWAEGVLSGERRRRRSLASFRRHPIFDDALILFEIGTEATGRGKDLVEQWKAGQVPTVIEKQREADQQGGVAGDGKRRRRRRRGRGGRGGPRDEGPGSPPSPDSAGS
ncbi:MAG TPA: polynucleotide adenylyltransferase PcnB [Myxococcales bacterium]|jgi:poly(A) polymerase